MGGERGVEDIDREVATAIGLFALSDATLAQAAAETEVTRWELEKALERADCEAVRELTSDANVSETIDELLEEG